MAVKDNKIQKSITLSKEVLLIINAIADVEGVSASTLASKMINDSILSGDGDKRKIYSDLVIKYVEDNEGDPDLLQYKEKALFLLNKRSLMGN